MSYTAFNLGTQHGESFVQSGKIFLRVPEPAELYSDNLCNRSWVDLGDRYRQLSADLMHQECAIYCLEDWASAPDLEKAT